MIRIKAIKNVLINLVLILVVVSFAYGALYFFFIYAVKFKNNKKIAIIERIPQEKWVTDIELCLSAYRPGPLKVMPRLIMFKVEKTSNEVLGACLSKHSASRRKLIRKLLKKYDAGTS